MVAVEVVPRANIIVVFDMELLTNDCRELACLFKIFWLNVSLIIRKGEND